MLSLQMNHTYTVKLKFSYPDSSPAAPPPIGGVVSSSNSLMITNISLLDPSTVKFDTKTIAGNVTLTYAGPGGIVGTEVFNIPAPPPTPPAVAVFDETTLVQTA